TCRNCSSTLLTNTALGNARSIHVEQRSLLNASSSPPWRTTLSMSALGQKRTHAAQQGVSALPRKRTCAVQLGMSALGQKRTSHQSLNNLVGGRKKRWRNSQAQRLCCL